MKNKLNKIFSKNPNFVFYDHENECVGKDLLNLISKLLKDQKEELQKQKIITLETKMLKDKKFQKKLNNLTNQYGKRNIRTKETRKMGSGKS